MRNKTLAVIGGSETIIRCLKSEAGNHNVEVRTRTPVERILATEGQRYQVHIRGEESIEADAVLVATGGSNRSSRYAWTTGWIAARHLDLD